MRLDKYLKVSRLIKRRTVANEACDAGRVLVNDKPAKASVQVKTGDTVEILNLSEDLILSDNYFDMSAGEKRVKILGKASRKVEDPADWENQIKEQLADGLKLRSVYDIR